MDSERILSMSDGAGIRCRLWRPGRPRRALVLLHGLASNHTRWSEFARTTALRNTWDLLRPDQRGFGATPTRRGAGLDGWSRDLAGILRAAEIPEAVVIGHCLGANVALHAAVRDPARILGLVLVEPMLRGAFTGSMRLAARLRPAVAAGAAAVRGLNALGLRRRRFPVLDLERLDREARAGMASGSEEFLQRRYGSVLEDLKTTPAAVYLAGLLAVTAPPPDLSRIAVPALSLLSDGGRFGDPARTTGLLAALPRGEVRTIDAHHWIPTEAPDAMRRAIESWCAAFGA